MSSIKTRISKLNELIANDEIKISTNGDANFRIFDYDPTDRYIVNDYLYTFIYPNNEKKIVIIDIYKTIIEILKEIDFMDIIIEEEKKYGTAYANKTIQDVLGIRTIKDDLLKDRIISKIKDSEKRIVIITGLEGCFQIIRGHTILSNIEPYVTDNLVIMLYPGMYDGKEFKMFNKLDNDNCYNATIIVEREENFEW